MPFYNIKCIHFIPIATELWLQHQLKRLESTVSSHVGETFCPAPLPMLGLSLEYWAHTCFVHVVTAIDSSCLQLLFCVENIVSLTSAFPSSLIVFLLSSLQVSPSHRGTTMIYCHHIGLCSP